MSGEDEIREGDPIRERELQSNAVPLDRAYERENYEPAELENPLPRWFAILSAGFVVWGASYFFLQGWTPADAGDLRRSPPAAGSTPVDGGVVYAANCVACHQASGAGLAGAFPPLDGSGWVLADPVLGAQILLHGVQGAMTVKGVEYAGVMPSMAHLTDAELAAVLSHVRSSWSNRASAVEADLLAEQRARFGERGPWQGGAELRAEVGEPLSPDEGG